MRVTKFFAVTILLAGCTKPSAPEPMVVKVGADRLKLHAEAIKNITIKSVALGDFPEKLALMGRVSVPEDRTVVVPSRVGGRTEQVFVASGETVKAGQPLCTIFSADFAVAREEFLQTKREAAADAESNHILDLSRRKLRALGVSDADISRWKDSTEKDEFLTVRAPRAGALLNKNAVIGSLVNVGDPLFSIGDLQKVWFAGDIYPEDLPKIRKDQLVVIDQGSGNPACFGKISFISPQVDPTSRTIKIRALMDNPENQLRADMFVQGHVVLSTRRALVAPKTALVRLLDQTFAFREVDGNVFQKVLVEIDGDAGDVVAVTKGLSDGDRVVAEGGLLLNAALSAVGPE